MKNLFTLIAVTCLLTSCNDSGFSGGSADQRTESGGAAVGEETAVPEACIEGDRITLNFPAEIQSCVDQNNIFDFNTNTCVDVSEASFDCSFDAMASTVAGIGVPNTSIGKAKDDGALLISCSEKNEGKTIIAQWYYPASTDVCNFDATTSTRIVTACYKLYIEGEAPPGGYTEQRSAAVQALS